MEPALRPLGPDIWSVTHPLSLGGVAFGTRTTALRTGEGVVLVSPGPLDDATAAAIDALGPVTALVAPNRFHHLFLKDARRRWPAARLHASAALPAQGPDLPVDVLLGEHGELAPGVAYRTVAGMPRLQEAVVHHAASGTLVVTDLCFHFVGRTGLYERAMLWMAGALDRFGPSRYSRSLMTDRAEVRRSVDAVLEWDFDRVLPAHGEPVPADGRARLREAFAFLG